MLSALILVMPLSALAEGRAGIHISLPPPVAFSAPPEVVVIPETYVYVVPDSDLEIFFYNGWWWRLWEGRWYRSRYYNAGWVYYQRVPSFYAGIPSNWRDDYRDHSWRGQQWNYRQIPQQQLQRNWKNWEKSRHWEKQQKWGVQGLPTRPQPQAVQPGPRPKPQQPAARQQQSKPQPAAGRQYQSQPQPAAGRPQRTEQHQEKPQQSGPQQGKPDRGGEEHRDRR
jgi:hypothetical protein